MHELAVFFGGVAGSMADPILNALPIVAGWCLGWGKRGAAVAVMALGLAVIVLLTSIQDLPPPEERWYLHRVVAAFVWLGLIAGIAYAWFRWRRV